MFTSDVVCFSHLRWEFVYQRPQHLMTRHAQHGRVFFIEEPVSIDAGEPFLDRREAAPNVTVLVPHVPRALDPAQSIVQQSKLVRAFTDAEVRALPVVWYYTPMAVPIGRDIAAAACVYDCMDELSAFKGAPQALAACESELFDRADVVFTGGESLFRLKRRRHPNCHCCPSAVDFQHFSRARSGQPDPDDQRDIPRPRIGYCGVIDERADLDLVAELAERRTDWHLIMLGPIVKISPTRVPRRPNIHYLGLKRYRDLPQYLSNWSVAMMPFARNEATRFISPTKTPEYLAAGKPVVATAIDDVVKTYGRRKAVRVAPDADAFVHAISAALEAGDATVDARLDLILRRASWQRVWSRMSSIVASAIDRRSSGAP